MSCRDGLQRPRRPSASAKAWRRADGFDQNPLSSNSAALAEPFFWGVDFEVVSHLDIRFLPKRGAQKALKILEAGVLSSCAEDSFLVCFASLSPRLSFSSFLRTMYLGRGLRRAVAERQDQA